MTAPASAAARTWHWIGGQQSLAILFTAGFVINGFTALDQWRAVLMGPFLVNPGWAVGLLAVASLLAWTSLFAKRAVWLSPADLTWRDGADRRITVLRGRLLAAWGWRVAAVGYAWTMAAALTHAPSVVWLAGTLAGVAVALVVLLILNPNRIARQADRTALVAGWQRQNMRRTAAAFLDPLALLGAARPLALSLAGGTVLRYTLLEMAGRDRVLLPALLLLLAAIVLVHLFPALPASAIVSLAGYLAALPAGGGLAQLWRNPGRRRWIGVSDARLRATTAVVFLGPVLVWCGLAVALGTPAVVLAGAPVIVAALIRTVTRPLPRYDDLGVVQSNSVGLIPTRLVGQTLRGLDLLAVGVVVLVLITR